MKTRWTLQFFVFCCFLVLGYGKDNYRLIPRVYNTRNMNETIKTTLGSKGILHLPSITWKLKRQEGGDIYVDFNLTKVNLGSDTSVLLSNNRIYRPTTKEKLQHHCLYTGRVREHPELTASITTCGGLRGQLNLGNGKVLNIRPLKRMPLEALSPLDSPHTTYMFRNNDFIGEKFNHSLISTANDVLSVPTERIPRKSSKSLDKNAKSKRPKRWHGEISRDKGSQKLLEAHESNNETKFVEIFVVADNSIYRKQGEFWALVDRIKNILKIANVMTRKANIVLVFTGLEVWDTKNKVPIPKTEHFEVLLFKEHTESLARQHKFDLVVYLVGQTFTNLYGVSFNGKMCSNSYAYILVADVAMYPAYAASTLAHSLAHTLNVVHDALHCLCPDEPHQCIMHEVQDTNKVKKEWSDCSLKAMKTYIQSGGGYCLTDRPTETMFGPTCGDGLIEEDEECDCGVVEYGNCSFSPCCDALTCKLKKGAMCANGACCNTTSCQYLSKGSVCRPQVSKACDIAETCTGFSAFCPNDIYLQTGTPCVVSRQPAYCYKGVCENHLSQCKKFYGVKAIVADSFCYSQQNIEGQPGGSCGTNNLDKDYPPCKEEDVWCGTLHCDEPNMTPATKTKFLGGLHILWTNYNNRSANNRSIHCKWVVFEVGTAFRDPGLVQDGVKCGKDSICMDSKCVKLDTLKLPKCPLCHNGGKCTNSGECECKLGYLPPFCKEKAPNFGYIKTGFNTFHVHRNLIMGILTGGILSVAVFFLIGLIVRKIVLRRKENHQFEFKVRTLSATSNNQTINNSNENHKKTKTLKCTSPKKPRKELTKIPSVKIYDIGTPFLQSSTNNTLYQLTAQDSPQSNEDSQPFPPAPHIAMNNSKPKEVIYANSIMPILPNGSMDQRPTKNDSKDEDEWPESPTFRYENVNDVRVQKENVKEMTHNISPPMNNSNSCLFYEDIQLPPVKYDNVDDLINVRCPTYQTPHNTTISQDSIDEDALYSIPSKKSSHQKQ